MLKFFNTVHEISERFFFKIGLKSSKFGVRAIGVMMGFEIFYVGLDVLEDLFSFVVFLSGDVLWR